jgi:tetraacyldisaccharide 4'-kinase
VDLVATLQAAWTGRGPLARVLWPAGALVGAIAARRRRRALDHPPPRLRVPVVVVGNLLVGGVGKTPVTLAVLDALRSAGWHPGVISRGYGRAGAGLHHVQPADDAATAGDEPLLLRRRAQVPVVVGADRVAAAAALLDAHPEVDAIVSDDGLQHHALPRDLQVVVFDERGAGNGWCLPAGPLREPMPPRPWPNTIVLYNAATATTPWHGLPVEREVRIAVPLADWWAGRTDDACALADLRGLRGVAVAGTARPARFFDALRAAGLVLDERPLPDHHRFDTLPWDDDVATVLVTEKDAVKLRPDRLAGARAAVWVVPLETRLPALAVAALLSTLGDRADPSRRAPG